MSWTGLHIHTQDSQVWRRLYESWMMLQSPRAHEAIEECVQLSLQPPKTGMYSRR